MRGAGRRIRETLGGDLEDLLAVDLNGGDVIGSDLAVPGNRGEGSAAYFVVSGVAWSKMSW